MDRQQRETLVKIAQVGLHFLMSIPPEYALMMYLVVADQIKKKKRKK